jgi:hypothetical protein
MTAKLYIADPNAAPSPDAYREIASGPEVDGYLAVIMAEHGGKPDRLVARIDERVTGLSGCEREFLKQLVRARASRPRSRSKAGRPATPEQKLAVTSTFLVFSVWKKVPRKRALGRTAEQYGLTEHSVEKAITFARRHDGGKWWADRRKLAAKRKPWPEIIAK